MHYPPTAMPPSLRLPGRRPFFRVARMGGSRQVLFFPLFVIKFGRGRQAELLRGEAARARAARRSPFWAELAVPMIGMGRWFSLSRRHGAVTLRDYDAIAAIVEDRLDATASVAPAPAFPRVAGNPMLAALPPEARQAAEAHLRRLSLPATGMHGDFHMFNFCRTAGRRYGVLDWERYDPAGSFAVDYVEFHAANRNYSLGVGWLDMLSRAEAPNAAAIRAAARLSVDPEALWLLFLLLRLNSLAERLGGFAAQPADFRARALDILGRQVARLRRPGLPAPLRPPCRNRERTGAAPRLRAGAAAR